MTRSFSKMAIISSLTFSLLTPVVSVSANGLAMTDTQNFKDNVKQQLQTAKAKIEQVREDLSEEKTNVMDHAFAAMQQRFATATARMKDIADKMSAKVTELGDKKVDTAAIKNLIASAKTKLESTSGMLVKAQEQFKALIAASDRQAAFQLFRTTIQSIQENLKAAHAALVEAAQKLRVVYQTLTPTA